MLETRHQLLFGDARTCVLPAASVDIIVTSPPYPMIEMWDAAFAGMNSTIGPALQAQNGAAAFELMHAELDKVWQHCVRVLKPGGTLCINIGDAVRTLGGDFQLYPNHVRIVNALRSAGLVQLPDILWRKPTNAPNKFMGSGMLPVGAYVTYEHEYILIFRKGKRRAFTAEADKRNRRASAFFWEERNNWFSDVWTDLRGTGQGLTDAAARQRSAAFPFELAYRLICMYAVYGDTVLDPFAGTGTTMAAAMAAGRHSVGVEIDASLEPAIGDLLRNAPAEGRNRVAKRLRDHREFIATRIGAGTPPRHHNSLYDFPVVTSQETDLRLYMPTEVRTESPGRFVASYREASEVTSTQGELFTYNDNQAAG